MSKHPIWMGLLSMTHNSQCGSATECEGYLEFHKPGVKAGDVDDLRWPFTAEA